MKAARVDENQKAIVEGLRRVGVSVQSLAAVGEGVPDLLCGWRGKNYLLEVKNPDMIPSKRKLTPDQVDWHDQWIGQKAVVHSLPEAMEVILEVKRDA